MRHRPSKIVSGFMGCSAVVFLGVGLLELFAEKSPSYPRSLTQMVKAHIGQNSTLSQGIKMYHHDMGIWPETLDDLITPPTDPTLRTKWTAYIEDRSDLKDPWGRDVRYRSGAKAIHNPGQFDLWSVGPDGVDGTEDDICNWKLDSKR